MKPFRPNNILILSLMAFFLTSQLTYAAEDGFSSLTTRLNIVGSNGTPTNDVLGVGLIGHYKFSDDWYLGIGLDYSPEFDFERTPKLVGLQQDTSLATIDATGDQMLISAFAERRYPNDTGDIEYFWSLGAGINEVDMNDVSGPLEGGGTFNISTKADTEFVIVSSVGIQQQFNSNWSGRYEFSVNRHFADWSLRDSISGNTGTIDDYSIIGLRLGLSYQFDQ